MLKKITTYIAGFAALSLSFVACKSDKNSPGFEYMPDMYHSIPYDTYGENPYHGGKDSMEARLPVKGTIPRGYMPYSYENTPEGYERAGAELKNPIPYSKDIVAEGKVLYSKYCQHCHGKKGEGDGPVANNDMINPPSYTGPLLKNLPVGKMYHSIYYGKGVMGSHASQINDEERWKIIHYIVELQNPGARENAQEQPVADTTAVAQNIEENE